MPDWLQTILALWGAVVSTYLAYLKLRDRKIELNHQVHLSAFSIAPFESVDIELTSTGGRPIIIKRVFISYGRASKNSVYIGDIPHDSSPKLNDSDYWRTSVPRDFIVTNVEKNKVIPKTYSRIWICIEISGGGIVSSPIEVGAAIIASEYYKPAEPWIAADLFLGFEQRPSGPAIPAVFTK